MDELIEAVQAGDVERAGELAAADPQSATSPGPNGLSPLMLALYQGRRDIVDVLIASGAEPDLYAWSVLGDVDRVGDIVSERPESLQEYSTDGWTALHLAAHFGNLEVARALLDAGADPDAISENGMANQPLHAAMAGRSTPVAQLLIEHGADVNATQHGGFTALHAAAQNGDLEAVRLLLDSGADPTVKTDDGRTAMDYAAESGNAGVEEALRDTA